MKVKSLSELGEIYSGISASERAAPSIIAETVSDTILDTDTSRYLPESAEGKVPSAGDALGGGPGTVKKEGHQVVPAAAKTGPTGLKGNNFKKIEKKNDPGADKSAMKEEQDGEAKDEPSTPEREGAKVTTSKEKIEESSSEKRKYTYNPKFTMAKAKFDQLYEEALNRIPFNEDDSAYAPPAEDHGGVPPATDTSADDGIETDGNPEEAPVTAEEAIECLEKVLKFLKDTHAPEGAEGEEPAGAGEKFGDHGMPDDGAPQGDVVAEDIDAEDEGSVLTKVNGSLKKGNPDGVNKPVTVGSLKAPSGKAGKADKGTIKVQGEPEELDAGDLGKVGPSKELQNIKKFKVNSAKGAVAETGKPLFDGS